jgi:hypothetical protein
MSSSVILFGFGRRETFKVSPTTPLSQLRDEFCSRNGLDAALYGLKYLQRDVDTSLTFRMANLPAGAKVEVIRREASTVVGDVRVAVQTGDGERKTAVIATTSSLWDLLLALYVIFCVSFVSSRCDSREMATVANSFQRLILHHNRNVDIPADTEPTLVYMNRSYTGVPVLSSTSLAKIGAAAGSSVLLRLQFGALSAQSDVPSPAASASRTVINEAFLETAKPAMDLAPPVATSSSVSSSSSSASSSASSSSSAASSSGATSVSRKSHVPEDRNVQVFLPSSNAPRIDLPEEYYEVTADDIKTLLASQQQSAAETEYLKTQAMRDAEAAKKARIYSKSVLRVRFPDGLLLQATFSPWETIGAVTLFVKSQLQDRDATFDLCMSSHHHCAQ